MKHTMPVGNSVAKLTLGEPGPSASSAQTSSGLTVGAVSHSFAIVLLVALLSPGASAAPPTEAMMDLGSLVEGMRAQARQWQAQATNPQGVALPGPLAGRQFESMPHFRRVETPGPCLPLSDGFGWRSACLIQRDTQTRLIILVLSDANRWVVTSDQMITPPPGLAYMGTDGQYHCSLNGRRLAQGFGFLSSSAKEWIGTATHQPSFWTLDPHNQPVPLDSTGVRCAPILTTHDSADRNPVADDIGR